MKTNTWYMKTLMLLAVVMMASCNDEPIDPALLDAINNPNDQNNPIPVTGTYVMTAFNTSVPVDLNNDGVSNNNHMLETNCYNNSFLVLNNNNTFTATGKGVEIETDSATNTTTIACYDDGVTAGTWTLSGNNVSFNYVFDGETFSDTFVRSGNTLTYTIQGGEVVGTANGQPVYLTTNIEIIYTKQ